MNQRHPRVVPLAIAAVATLLIPPLAPAPLAAQCATSNPYCGQLRALADHAAVTEALGYIERTDDQAIRDLVRLTEIPAPPFMEDRRARVYADMLRGAGADSVWIDDEGNVLALREGTRGGGTVAIAGHLDTVFPEGTDVSVTQRGDTLFAPGVADDTRGLVVVLQVLRAMESAGLETEADVLFIGTVGEEGLGDLRGMKHLFREGGPRIDAFMSVDGSGSDRIVHMALGSRRYRVTYQGPGGHSWGAFGLANPHHALGRAIAMFDETAHDFTRASNIRTSYNVGRIGGGTSINSIPFESWMEVDMRSESQSTLMEIDNVFRSVMHEALHQENAERAEGDSLTVDVELVGDRPSGVIPESDPLVRRAEAATRHVGFEPRLTRSSTDSNIPISKGVPAVTIGGGGIGYGAHSLDEYFVNDEGHVGIQRALLILAAQAGVPGVSTR